MKATKLVIGAGLLIALVGAMPAAAADPDYCKDTYVVSDGATSERQDGPIVDEVLQFVIDDQGNPQHLLNAAGSATALATNADDCV